MLSQIWHVCTGSGEMGQCTHECAVQALPASGALRSRRCPRDRAVPCLARGPASCHRNVLAWMLGGTPSGKVGPHNLSLFKSRRAR